MKKKIDTPFITNIFVFTIFIYNYPPGYAINLAT